MSMEILPKRIVFYPIAALIGIGASYTVASAEPAPITWPSGWILTEETDSDGDTTWTATKVNDEEIVIASINLMRMGGDPAVEKDFEGTFAQMQAVAKAGLEEDGKKAVCTKGIKTEVSTFPALEGTCELVGDAEPLKLLSTMVLGKKNIYAFNYVAQSNVYEKFENDWKTVRASAKFE